MTTRNSLPIPPLNGSEHPLSNHRLLRAAVSGLLAVGATAACSDDNKSSDTDSKKSSQDLSDTELQALCADIVKKAEDAHGTDSKPDLDALCTDKVQEAKDACEKPDTDKLCADKVKSATAACPEPAKPDTDKLCADKVKSATAAAATPKTKEEKTISSEQKEYTFAALTTMCDDRGGYTQVHAACGSQNTCKGFSYGDWGPGAATLTEHSCTGVNGCLGLSCVVLPEDKDSKRSGADLYQAKYSDPGPGACSNCHAAEVEGSDKPDITKFNLYLLADSTRTTSNWLDRSAAEQERVVAFGVHGIVANGPAYQNMAPYNTVLSRKEIERVVAYIRTLQPVVHTIKVADPVATAK